MKLRGTVFDIWESVLIENDGHFAEMTKTFFICRQEIRATKRTMLVHGKNSLYSLNRIMQTMRYKVFVFSQTLYVYRSGIRGCQLKKLI
jgi:hypothetical protein